MSEEFACLDQYDGDVEAFTKYRAIEARSFQDNSVQLLQVSSSQPSGYGAVDSLNISSKHFVEVAQTKPSRVPVASSSSVLSLPVTIIPTVPKCSEKPCHLANTNFYCDNSNFEALKSLIEENLYTMTDFDWNYFDDDHMWKCKYLEGSNMREFHITCFWDSAANDHIVEVKRVRGDGLQPSNITDIFAKLKSKLCKRSEDSPVVRRGKLRGPLPLPNLKLGGSLKNALGVSMASKESNVLTEEQFLKGVTPIVTMTEDNCFEPRLEAARMLCDLAITTKTATLHSEEKLQFLSGVKCRELVMKALIKLIQDDFEDVKQFAVVAFEAFSQYEAYQECLCHENILLDLVQLIRNCPPDVPSYICAAMRRKAAQGVATLASRNPGMIHHHLELCGFRSANQWKEMIVQTLYDHRTRMAADKITLCFEVPAVAPVVVVAAPSVVTPTTSTGKDTVEDAATVTTDSVLSSSSSLTSSDDDEEDDDLLLESLQPTLL